MSGDRLDVDAIKARTASSPAPHREDVRALVAEVRRLRAELDMSQRLLATMDHFADVAETCERKANESHARREAAEAELQRVIGGAAGYFAQGALDARLAHNEGGALLRVQALHDRDSTGACGWCGVEWPCATAVAAAP